MQVTVILTQMFTVEELSQQSGLEAELQADIMDECKQFGAIDKLRLFPQNPEGIVMIKFRTPDAAVECIRLMNGRFFAARQVSAFPWGMLLPSVQLLVSRVTCSVSVLLWSIQYFFYTIHNFQGGLTYVSARPKALVCTLTSRLCHAGFLRRFILKTAFSAKMVMVLNVMMTFSKVFPISR